MKAVIAENGKLVMQQFPEPIPHEDELLVEIKTTALNRADLVQKQGNYPLPEGTSPIMGIEMAGVVTEVGSKVTDWKVGDHVCAILPSSGYAEKVAIPAAMAIPIPVNFSFEQAAAIPEVFLTAYLNLYTLGNLQAGDDVLIHAGASGVGTAAIQLVREAGARSIITAGTDSKRAFCMELGASKAIDYRAGPFVEEVLKATDGKGVNIVLDFIGAPYFEQNIQSLDVDGKLLLVGVLGGRIVQEVNLMDLKIPRIQLIGTMLRVQPIENKIKLTREFSEYAIPLFESGKLEPVIDSVWDMDKINEAHTYMEENKNIGKIIIKVND
ncbi:MULTISPECIES: NAD(P)H-quinone oxidoreductase [unclassified Sporosarcina]|uniref:NAD(P)H-quinone oxidoreductase n=1 Tax=unclassified Sporosarcina TaxID=2647733 RepID=UPI000C168BE1|nr:MULTISPECIES: NAD(P)H-quinone oxidoreductase [unclassified Sporosarcina]PID05853.1 NADPH:quinone oxidoreductase [Sporosarcina sp. P30]PID09047.1 NADPH:quinone oxidoreductase [Sporosarcina sp. P31]PID12344.1 NADPH:quinone oxidoreductase [Sporosarcina sp. P32b]